MKVVIYSNCQGAGLAMFLQRVRPELSVSVHLNYRMILGEENPADLLNGLEKADVFIFQPSGAFECKGGWTVPSTDDLCKLSPKSCLHISMPYCWNTGFFPVVKSGKWWTGDDVMELAKGSNWFDLLTCYDRNLLIFDCARRFIENLQEQARREEQCSIHLAPWILQNFQTKHLFLLHNHPGSALLVELAHRVLMRIGMDCDEIPYDGPTDGGRLTAVMPGYHGVHPLVMRELGLTFEPNRTGEDMEFYRTLVKELAETKGKL